MEPLAEGDSSSRVRREGEDAIDQMARDVSMASFGAAVPRRQVYFAGSTHITGLGTPDI